MKTFTFIRSSIQVFILGVVVAGLSAATAQVSWRTTHTTNNTMNTGATTLVSSSMRVKVFPSYLDVEEDVEIRVSGIVSAANDANTLEIVANFTLPVGSAITGALLWDGTRVLQAKLLDQFKADSIYEDLVDRDSVPPPRPIDPLILSRTGANSYTLKVYPVALNSSRRLRLRYQLPPRLGVEGFEIRMQGAIIPFFTPTTTTFPVTIENGGAVPKIVFVDAGLRRDMTLPRTVFIARSALNATSAAHATNSTRVLPLDTLRQVQVKTSFDSGAFSGHYLNLYASIDDKLLKALGQKVEVVIFWKWNNLETWFGNSGASYRSAATSQASEILQTYTQLGGPGNQIGLLHDNSYNAQRLFPVASKGDSNYRKAVDYLTSLQGGYVNDFLANLQFSGGVPTTPEVASKSRFRQNMQIIKTLYSPDQGVTRHLIMVSAGVEGVSQVSEMNAVFDSVFQDKPISLSALNNRAFNQIGFDFFNARLARPITGTVSNVTYGTVPGFPSMNVVATVRNAQRAYDFSIACTGGASITCGTLQFQGKATSSWKDTVEWEAYHAGGKLAGSAKTVPTILTRARDTAIVRLWAGSSSPFSEKPEPPLGPTYGFVDQWASLLALERDSLSQAQKVVYADTGVPNSGPVPGYLGPSAGSGTAIAPTHAAANVAAWKLQRVAYGAYEMRIPGLAAQTRVELALYDLTGKRIGSWTLMSGVGTLLWNPGLIKPGTYVIQLRGPNISGRKVVLL
jgi:hypothetical protein